jgi:hypothetical protein
MIRKHLALRLPERTMAPYKILSVHDADLSKAMRALEAIVAEAKADGYVCVGGVHSIDRQKGHGMAVTYLLQAMDQLPTYCVKIPPADLSDDAPAYAADGINYRTDPDLMFEALLAATRIEIPDPLTPNTAAIGKMPDHPETGSDSGKPAKPNEPRKPSGDRDKKLSAAVVGAVNNPQPKIT